MAKTILIAGYFDDFSGRKSGFINKFQAEFNADVFMNGGEWRDLANYCCCNNIEEKDTVLWFADVPNDKPKIINDLKIRYPKILLVTSKRNFNEYSVSDILNRALKTKSNLLIEMGGSKSNVLSTIWDPLGVTYTFREPDIKNVVKALKNRLEKLKTYHRVGSKEVGDKITINIESKFYELIKNQAEKFHEIIHGVGHERMMGNASFRCAKGFPSVRSGELIFVSKRNIDKRYIEPENFIAVRANEYEVEYYGKEKPSVDTPIQIRLYNYYKNVNYMLHSHTYIEGAKTTNEPVPCGAIEESDLIFKLFPDSNEVNFAVNLFGHGSIILANNLDVLSNQKWISREVPEKYVE